MCNFHIKTHASAELHLSELWKSTSHSTIVNIFNPIIQFPFTTNPPWKIQTNPKIFKRRSSLLLSSIHRGIPQGSGLGCPTWLTLPLIHNRPGVIILKMFWTLSKSIPQSVCTWISLWEFYIKLNIFLRMRPSVWFGLHVEIKYNEPV